jgi:hypothetical protein
MKIEVTIHADTVEEFWKALTAFRTSRLIIQESEDRKAQLPPSGEVDPSDPAQIAGTADTKPVPGKRGPGRPPKNSKPDVSEDPPQIDTDSEPQTVAATGEAEEGASEGELRADLVDRITAYWKTNDAAMRKAITEFKQLQGIPMLSAMQGKDFGAARTLLQTLNKMGQP